MSSTTFDLSNLMSKFNNFQPPILNSAPSNTPVVTFQAPIAAPTVALTEETVETQEPKRQKLSEKITLITYLENNELDYGSRLQIARQVLDEYTALQATKNKRVLCLNKLQIFIPSNLVLHFNEDGKISVIFKKITGEIIQTNDHDALQKYYEEEIGVKLNPKSSRNDKILIGKVFSIIFKKEVQEKAVPFGIRTVVEYIQSKNSKLPSAMKNFNNIYNAFFQNSQKS